VGIGGHKGGHWWALVGIKVGIGGHKGGHWWAIVGEKVGIGGRLLKNEIGLSLFRVI